MTRQELMNSIKHLPWKRNWFGALRCSSGDCPIMAAYRIQFPQLARPGSNSQFYSAGQTLGLSDDEINAIVSAADSSIQRIPELEPER
jgi:hypothetical protein